MKYVLVGYAKNMNQVSDIFKQQKELLVIFSFYCMLELEGNAYCVALHKDPEKG